MMSLCVGLLRPSGGEINVLGLGPFDAAKHVGRVSILPQDSRLPLHAKTGDLLWYYGRLQGIDPRALRGQVDQLLEWVNLADRRSSPVKSLSHGMMRRLTIAQAFLGEPELIFLDEPMSGLDPREVARLRDLLVQRRGRQAIVISSHVLSEIEAMCDTVAFVDKGRLVKQGTLSSLMKMHHRVVYALRPGPVPLDRLREATPAVEWILAEDGRSLRAELPDGMDLADFNAKSLAVLLAAGVGVEEVRRGSDLESEFFAATAK